MGEAHVARVVGGPWHPVVPLVFSACVLVLTMAAFEPVCCALAFGGGLLFALVVRGPRGAVAPLVWQLPLLALVCLANPLFTGLGTTLVCTVGRRAVYLESLAFGLNMGLMLLAALTWCSALGEVVGVDEALAVLGRPLPVVALMVSMAMRMVPLFARRGREMADLQAACTASRRRGGAASDVTRRVRLVTALVGWGLEDSFELSDSMVARGWGGGLRRTAYRRGRFRWRDGLALCVLLALVTLDVAALVRVCGAWHYYPTLAGPSPVWAYLPHACVMALPTVVHAGESLRWSLAEGAAGRHADVQGEVRA